MAKKQLILGIDLGTTFSLACLRIGDEQFHFFTPEPGGDPLVPSVFLNKADENNGHGGFEILVGAKAEAEGIREEHRPHAVRHVKRFMKRNYQEGDQEPEKFLSHGKEFLPSEISGYILKTLKTAAEQEFCSKTGGIPRSEYEWLGYIYSAVITVPAYFGPSEREATRDAAKFAGFSPPNVELLDEPVAAALSLGLHKEKGCRIILVVDVGGGTTDVTLLKVGQAVENGGFFELGRIGDTELGGVDIDEMIVHSTIFSKKRSRYTAEELDSLEDKRCQGVFFQRAETEKKKVCRLMRERKREDVFFEVRFREPIKNELFEFKFNEQWFRDETDDLIEYCARLCDFLLQNVDRREAGVARKGHGISWKQIDEVWMVGGSSLMPHLQDRLISRLGDPKKLRVAPRPQHAVAEGAAVYADMLARGQRLPGIDMPRCPCDIGIMVDPVVSWWQRLCRWGRRRLPWTKEQVESKPARVFYTLIRSNTLLSDEKQRSKPYRSRVLPGADGQVHIDICQRFVSRWPTVLNGRGNATAANAKMCYSIRTLRRLTIPKLAPVPGHTDLETVRFIVTYEPDHTLHFKASFRGHALKPVVVKEGEFDMLFEADTINE